MCFCMYNVHVHVIGSGRKFYLGGGGGGGEVVLFMRVVHARNSGKCAQ